MTSAGRCACGQGRAAARGPAAYSRRQHSRSVWRSRSAWRSRLAGVAGALAPGSVLSRRPPEAAVHSRPGPGQMLRARGACRSRRPPVVCDAVALAPAAAVPSSRAVRLRRPALADGARALAGEAPRSLRRLDSSRAAPPAPAALHFAPATSLHREHRLRYDGRMRTILLSVIVTVGCGTTTGGTSDGPGQPVVDGSPKSDGATPTVDTLQCKTHTFTTNNAGGTRTIASNMFAIVDGIDPLGSFVVESCDLTITQTNASGTTTTTLNGAPVDPACPANATCTAGGDAYPTFMHFCSFTRGGSFIDGKLYVFCGLGTQAFDATGKLTSVFSESYATIRLHH